MKNINNQTVISIVLLVSVFVLGGLVVNMKSQITHIDKMIEHLDEEVDEAKTGVERLLKRGDFTSNIRGIGVKSPKIELDSTEHDFGIINKKDGIVITNFSIKNNGAGELIIGDITTSCGCTSADVNKTKVESGGGAILTVNFDPNFHEEPKGRFSRSVFVPTNDPENRELEFKIFVEIKN